MTPAYILPALPRAPTCTAASNPVTAPTPTPTPARRRLRARIAYDGTHYSGWQYQKNAPTVQAALEACISRRCGAPVRVVGASRTDAGVHARGQAAHFDVPAAAAALPAEGMQYALNQMLPPDVRVLRLGAAPLVPARGGQGALRPWDAMFCSCGKRYVYRFSTGKVFDPLERPFRYHEWRAARFGFSEKALREAAEGFVGTRDFSAFTNVAATPPGVVPAVRVNPVRTVREVSVVDEGGGCFRIEFVIDGALYRMIRNIVGVMLDVAVGKRGVEDVEMLFEKRDRRLASKSAPAEGLCLEEVFYDGWAL